MNAFSSVQSCLLVATLASFLNGNADEPVRHRGTKISILGFMTTQQMVFPSEIEQDEDRVKIERVGLGDWSDIHQVYAKQDLKALWQYWQWSTKISFGFSQTDGRDGKVGMPRPMREEYNKVIEAYVTRLLIQVPGHAKLLADELDKNPAYLRQANLQALAKIKSPEAIQQIARFLDDTRGQLTPEEAERILNEARKRMDVSDYPFYGHSQALGLDVVPHLDLALGDESPLKDLRKADGGFISKVAVGHPALKAWWASPASAKYRELPKNEPPVEPPPPKIDMKQWVKEHDARTENTAAKADQASTGWNGWLMGGLTVAVIVTTTWLSSQRRA